MGEPARKAFLFGVAMFLLAAFITICVIIYNKGQNVVNKSDKQLSTTVSNISQGDLADYDGTNVRGDKVISAVNKFATSQFSVIVITKADNATTTRKGGLQYGYNNTEDDVTTASGYKITDINNIDYIESNATFGSHVKRNASNTPVSIIFTQD